MSLAESRNLPAMKAANIAGMANVINVAKAAGETHIGCGAAGECSDPFLAIGSGTVQLDEHTAAYAALANNGVAKPETYVLKIEKSNGEIVQQWKDTAGTPLWGDAARSQEISYILSDILADDAARSVTFGRGVSYFNPKGVKSAIKTGTTDNSKDGWMMGYSPKLAVGVWAGRSDGQAMGGYTDSRTGPIFGQFIRDAHSQVLTKPQYGYKVNEWYTQPKGVQKLSVSGRSDLFPSWYKKPKEEAKDYVMDRVSKKLATLCTPEAAKETIKVVVMSDPTKPNSQVVGAAPDGYDVTKEDDVHQCGVEAATNFTIQSSGAPSRTRNIEVSFAQGPNAPQTVEFIVNGQVISSQPGAGGSYSTQYTFPDVGTYTIQIRVTDGQFYQSTSSSQTIQITS